MFLANVFFTNTSISSYCAVPKNLIAIIIKLYEKNVLSKEIF